MDRNLLFLMEMQSSPLHRTSRFLSLVDVAFPCSYQPSTVTPMPGIITGNRDKGKRQIMNILLIFRPADLGMLQLNQFAVQQDIYCAAFATNAIDYAATSEGDDVNGIAFAQLFDKETMPLR